MNVEIMYNGPARAMIFAQGPPEFPPETPWRSRHHQQQRRIVREGLHHGAIESFLRQARVLGRRAATFETAVVDYVIGGGGSLRAAGSLRFKRFDASLTDGYEPPSTRTILRRIAQPFRIALPTISASSEIWTSPSRSQSTAGRTGT
jgi:hypothetical protein